MTYECFVPCLVEMNSVFLSKILSFIFALTSLWKRGWPYLNPQVTPWLAVPSLFKIGLVLLEKNMLKFSWCALLFSYYHSLEKYMILYQFERTWIPLNQESFLHVWSKMVKWIWRRKFLNVVNVFPLLSVPSF